MIHLFIEKNEIHIINIFMLIINMLIPDLLNTLFDQCDYGDLIVLRSLNKRKTNYANRYSLLRYYEQTKHTVESVCDNGNIKTVKHIIFHTHVRDFALGWSSFGGHLEVVKYLVSVGANIHADNAHALRWSAENGHLEVVKFLVSIGANIHADDDFAFRWSAENGHLEVVKYLVNIGANIHAYDDYALRWSTTNGHPEVIEYLTSYCANRTTPLLGFFPTNNDVVISSKLSRNMNSCTFTLLPSST